MKNSVSSFFISIIIVGLVFCVNINAQKKEKAVETVKKIADLIIENTDFKFVDKSNNQVYNSTEGVDENIDLVISSPYNDWRYWNGVMNIGFLELGKITGEKKYSSYPYKSLRFAFNNYKFFEKKYDGSNKWQYPFGSLFIMEELDDCGAMGASVLEVLNLHENEIFEKYVDKAANHILNKQSRLDDGTLVRAFPYKWTIWVDDLYMGNAFLARYGIYSKEVKYFDHAAKQVINYHNLLFDSDKGIMCHNYYTDIKQKGIAYWGRANGWAAAAQIDLLERLPKGHPQTDTLTTLFKKHILGIAKWQSEAGLWHQLLDKNDSYLETSCTAMFTYAIAKAVNIGVLSERYSVIALKGWEGIETKITANGDVEGVCAGTIVYDELSSYYKRPTPLNDIHGLGTVILAGTEIIKLLENK